MKFKLSQTQQYFLGIGIFGIILLIVYLIKNRQFDKILENPKYTIGNIYEIKHFSRKSDSYMYNYKVDSKDLKIGISSNASNNLFIGKRYFVIFEEGNPENSMLIPFMFVPDNIIEAPEEGWKEPPVPIDKEKIRKFLENY